MSEILKSQLYLGDYQTVKTNVEDLIDKTGVTVFINVACEVSYSDRVINYLGDHNCIFYKFNLSDNESDIYRKHSEVIELMNLLISHGCCVYIHCHLGVSRAPSMVLAYLMKYHDYSLEDATEYVQQRRPQIALREDFLSRIADVQ